MKKLILIIIKYLILLCIGGAIYISIELIYRGFSHWSMFVVGGICFIACGLINEVLNWETPLVLQGLIGATLITLIEFISGYILNIIFKLNIWDYSHLPLAIMGQICLPFSLIWFFLGLIAIILDDYIRYKLFNEEKPHYKLF